MSTSALTMVERTLIPCTLGIAVSCNTAPWNVRERTGIIIPRTGLCLHVDWTLPSRGLDSAFTWTGLCPHVDWTLSSCALDSVFMWTGLCLHVNKTVAKAIPHPVLARANAQFCLELLHQVTSSPSFQQMEPTFIYIAVVRNAIESCH
jgi:hypothetical protein